MDRGRLLLTRHGDNDSMRVIDQRSSEGDTMDYAAWGF